MPTLRQLKRRYRQTNIETTKLILTAPVDMVNRFRQQAVRDGCTRSEGSAEPNLTKWAMLTLASSLDEDLTDDMIPYKGPGRRYQ